MKGSEHMNFSMPMFRSFVPERIRPFIYLAFAVIFQLSGGIYLGALADMKGEMSLLQEDIMMCGYAGFIGLTMPFPLLFRLKFRFSNRKMLIFCASAIILCNIAALYTESLPVLWVTCFIAGWCKLWGTFESLSNIQLWITPERDFQIFFPILYIIILSGIELSGIMTEACAYFLTWKFAPVTVMTLLLLVIAALHITTVDFRPMKKPFPLYGIDWTGLVLWSFLLMELAFIFIYGEHYNWLEGKPVAYTAMAVMITAGFCFGRMGKIRHPYIEIRSWKYNNITPAVILFIFTCIITSSSTVLESAFSHTVIPSSPFETMKMHILKIGGVISGSLICLYWFKVLKMSIGKLTIFGMILMITYCFCMYFLISPDTSQQQLRIPVFLLQTGYAIIFTSLTLYIQAQMPFQHFFQGLCIIGMARTVLGSAIGGALYGYLMRYNMTDHTSILSSAIDPAAMASVTADLYGIYGDMMRQALMMSVKNLFGMTASCGFMLIAGMLIFDSPIRRRNFSFGSFDYRGFQR